MIKVLIIEDEVMIAEDLAATCRDHGYDVLQPAYTPGDGLNKLKNEKVDIVILDINLESSIDGIEIATYINQQLRLPFIYLSSYSDPKTLAAARNTKPMAYITKPFKRADIYTTIEIALENWKLFDIIGFPTFQSINEHLHNKITPREYELLQQLHLGKSNKEIADSFYISLSTVKSHLKNLYRKLEVVSRLAALSKIRQIN